MFDVGIHYGHRLFDSPALPLSAFLVGMYAHLITLGVMRLRKETAYLSEVTAQSISAATCLIIALVWQDYLSIIPLSMVLLVWLRMGEMFGETYIDQEAVDAGDDFYSSRAEYTSAKGARFIRNSLTLLCPFLMLSILSIGWK